MGSSGYLITKASPGPMGIGTTARLVRTDRGRQLHGSMEVTKYEPVHSFTEVSRFGPFSLHARATLAPVAPASTRLELVIDTHARGAIRLLLPLMKGTFGKTMARSLRIIKQHVEATPSPHDMTHLETSGTSPLACHIHGMPWRTPLLRAFAAGQGQSTTVR